MSEKKSLLQSRKECYICRIIYGKNAFLTSEALDLHHVFYGTANRKKSDITGMVIWLCRDHHTAGELAVHRNKKIDLSIKREAQRKFEENYTRDEFREIFGKSWL